MDPLVGNVHRKVKGSPAMTTVITDGWASAAGETLLTDTRDERGENEFPAALASSLPQLPSCYLFQWQGQEPIIPLYFPPLKICTTHKSHDHRQDMALKESEPCPVWPENELQRCPVLNSWQQHFILFQITTSFRSILFPHRHTERRTRH